MRIFPVDELTWKMRQRNSTKVNDFLFVSFSEMTVALYLSVDDQNGITENIWLNTANGSDYINQTIDEIRLVKKFRQTKIEIFLKIISVVFCFVFFAFFIFIVLLLIKQRWRKNWNFEKETRWENFAIVVFAIISFVWSIWFTRSSCRRRNKMEAGLNLRLNDRSIDLNRNRLMKSTDNKQVIEEVTFWATLKYCCAN